MNQDKCPCGGIILADTENWKTPLCYTCYTDLFEGYSKMATALDELKAELYQKHDVTCPYPDCKRPFWYQQKPNPNMGSAFTVMAKDPPPPKYSELSAKLDELKAEIKWLSASLEAQKHSYRELKKEKDELTMFFMANESATAVIHQATMIKELTAALRDMVGALEHYKGSTLSDENGLHKEGTDALTRVARDILAKHADLIGKLKV